MAFFRLTLYAAKLDRITQKLKVEKEAGSAISKKEKPKYGWRSKLSHVWINLKKRLRNCLINLYFLRNTAFDRFLYRLRKYGSFENYILKSILGFIGGYVLTYLLFLFLAVQLNVRLSVATVICCFLGCILTIGLAFSQNIRCIVFLTLPQFFSKRGRQALIAYALILTMTGPAKNTLNNMGIMSESLACGQEQLKSAVKQILDVIKKPFVAIKEALKAVVKAVKEVIKKIKEILLKIKRVIMAIIGVIKSVFEFLGRILNLCNKELGTPFQRCSRVFESAIADCQASLGPFFSWACSLGYLVNAVCYIVKPFDLVCMLVDFISNSIIGVVMRKIKIFVRHVKTMFYVRIKFSHSYHFESKSSKSMKEIASSIVGEVKMRTKEIVSVFQFFNCAASLFFIFLISRVIYYRHQFLTKERFDNKFLTKNLVDIDLRRAAMEKETIFPLNHRERNRYITIKSVRLLAQEKKQLTQGLGLLMSTALKCGTHMAIDYSLFWIMNLIRKYGKFQSKVQPPNIPTMHIAGQGLLADLLKAVVKSFQPLGISLEIDTVPCLPTPIPPDYDRYVQIASILGLCMLLTILEPYGLRWRNWILCYYYPRRAKERAVWLYNHILRGRSSFLKYARRQLRRKVLGNGKIAKVTCLEYLRARTNNKCLLLFLGSDKQQACLLCGEVFRRSDKEPPIKCQRPGCTAIYCKQCFEDLENVCTVCLSPIEYGDLSDFSEERDSSDEEYTKSPEPNTETEEFDSGMTTDEGSTDDYSYGYQEAEKAPSLLTDYRTESSRDLEKQSSPDYVSMQYFDDEIELYSFKPSGLEDKDEETQFPDDSSSMDKKISSDTSSVASSFEKDKSDHYFGNSQSCNCLDLDGMEDPSSGLLLEDSKFQQSELSVVAQGNEDSESEPSPTSPLLEPIQQQTENEALIQFSSDGETEVKSNLFGSYQVNSSSGSTTSKQELPSLHKAGEDAVQSEEAPGEDKLLSDSEYSEEDVQKLVGTPGKKNGYESIKTEGSDQSSKIINTTSISALGTEERHIEFIGLRKKKRTSTSTNSSPDGQEKTPTKMYQSTISTRTSKQDFSIDTKQKKSILKADSGSSILTEMKGIHEKVPNLHLEPLKEQSGSETIPSPSRSDRSKTQSGIGFDSTPESRRIDSSDMRTSQKTNEREMSPDTEQKKSISRADSGSSIISEIKELQGKMPKLNLELLKKKTGSKTVSSPFISHRLKSENNNSYDSTARSRRISSSDERNWQKKEKDSIDKKEKKPSLKGSVLSEMKDLRGNKTVPKLDLELLKKKAGSDTISSPTRSVQLKSDDSMGYALTTKSRIAPKDIRKSRKTDKTEKRLKGGANIPIFFMDTEKFPRENSPLEAFPCQSSRNEANISSPHLSESEYCSSFFTVFSSQGTSRPLRHPPEFNLIDFESSDTSVSPHDIGIRSQTSSSSSYTHDFNLEDLNNSYSMSTDISTAQPKTENTRPILKSDNSNSTKKSARLSLTLEETEDTSDEHRTLEDTDASSDLSISVQENILGIPRSRRKKGKIDWKHETELRSEDIEAAEEKSEGVEENSEEGEQKPVKVEEESEKVEQKSKKLEQRSGNTKQRSEDLEENSKVDESGEQSKEKIDKQTKQSFNETTSNENISGQALDNTIEKAEDTDINTSTQIEKLGSSEKFRMAFDDPRFLERRAKRCQCCKCRDKLPITHHIPGGDPDRRILLQTGKDSFTQTCIDHSDRSSQIECDCSTARQDFSGVSSNKSCSIRCKLKDEAGRSSLVSKPEKHCPCKVCCRLNSLEEDRPRQKNNPVVDADGSFQQKKCSIPRRKTVGTFCKPQTRDQVSYTHKPFGKKQVAHQCQKFEDNISYPQESNESISSNNVSYRDRFDLPYQDNEEYKRLVRELEEKLIARNRERVRKTMKEFEKCSTRNQNLRKPILYDDSSCGEEPILNKLVNLKAGDAGDKSKVKPSPPWKKSVVKGVNTVETMPKEISPRPPRISPRSAGYYYERDPTHWQLDTLTGEWYRASDVDIRESYDVYDVESRYSQPMRLPRRRMVERYEEELECEDCDDLNRRYGHRNNVLLCPRHRLGRFPPRHRKR